MRCSVFNLVKLKPGKALCWFPHNLLSISIEMLCVIFPLLCYPCAYKALFVLSIILLHVSLERLLCLMSFFLIHFP